MKNIIVIVLVFSITITVFGQINETNKPLNHHPHTSKVEFWEGDWGSLLAKAKESNKPFYVDIYTTWCAPCKKMSRETFTDEEVGKFSNQYFIAYKIDAEKGEGLEIADKYKVRGYPTILFFNAQGKLVGKEESFMDAEKFLYAMEKYLKKSQK